MIIDRIKNLFSKKNRVLLSELVRTDFKLRYQASVLGYAWSLLRPLFLFLILYVVFVYFFRVGGDIPNFPIYLLLGIVLWNFFAEMTMQSLGSIVGRGDLIRKIKIPRWIIVLSSSLSALINLFINLLVVGIFMLFSDVEISFSAILLIPTIIQIYIFALGISLFLSAAYVKYRDVSYIWEVLMQGGFYVTPILYSFTFIGDHILVKKLIFMNPMAQMIQDARYELVTQSTVTIHSLQAGWITIVPYALTLLILVTGVAYFRRESKYFAENI